MTNDRNDYHREYYAKNREKIREYQRNRYYSRKLSARDHTVYGELLKRQALEAELAAVKFELETLKKAFLKACSERDQFKTDCLELLKLIETK